MGVLKNLTDEYFKNTARVEDGRYIDFYGIRILVPADYDTYDFLKKVESIYTESFKHGMVSLPDDDTDQTKFKIKLKSKNKYMLIPVFEKFKEISQENEDVDQKLYDTYVLVMRHFLKDVELMKNTNWPCIVLQNIDFIYDELSDNGEIDNGYELEDIMQKTINEFFNEFKKKADIIKDEFHITITHSYECITFMDLTNESSYFEFKTLIYANEMVEWWKNKTDEIRKKGVLNYFGL